MPGERGGDAAHTARNAALHHTILVGTHQTGTASHLRTIKRSEGSLQVTYRGRPLYAFDEDRRIGAINGEGFRDVGVWRAVIAEGG